MIEKGKKISIYKDYLKINELEENCLYDINARHASVGIWLPDRKSFLISRWKFGRNYLFEEIHWDASTNYGTVKPFKKIEKCPIPIIRTRIPVEFRVYHALLDYLNKKEGG